MHTTPITGANAALNASPAPSANSSLANFLLAGASGNAQDFRSIAAALFGVVSSPLGQETVRGKDPIDAKGSGASAPAGKAEGGKSKKPSDLASPLATYPEMTVPIVVPEAIVQAPPKQESLKAGEETGVPGLQPARARLEGPRPLTSKLQSEDDQIAAMLAESGGSSATLNQTAERSPESLPPEVDRRAAKTQAPGNDFAAHPTPASPVENSKFVPVAAGSILQPGQKPGADMPPAPGKKSSDPGKSGERPQESGVVVPVKHESIPAPSVHRPAPADASVTAARSALQSAVAAPSVPVVPALEQSSKAPAKEMAENATAAKVASQSNPLINQAAVAGSKNAAERTSASEPSKVKGRSSKEKERGKDIGGASALGAKSAPNTGRGVAGATNFGGNSGKDGAGTGLANHSGAQSKPAPVKPSTGVASSAAAAEMDGPDEALPTSMSSPITAKFIQGMSGSEFRVGMQSQEFGSIDIRTSVARHMFSAQISVEHGDVAKSLATELPALYSKLADQQVPVANIVIQGQGLATSSGLAQDAQPQQGWNSQQSNGGASPTAEAILPVLTEGLESSGRLDIRI